MHDCTSSGSKYVGPQHHCSKSFGLWAEAIHQGDWMLCCYIWHIFWPHECEEFKRGWTQTPAQSMSIQEWFTIQRAFAGEYIKSAVQYNSSCNNLFVTVAWKRLHCLSGWVGSKCWWQKRSWVPLRNRSYAWAERLWKDFILQVPLYLRSCTMYYLNLNLIFLWQRTSLCGTDTILTEVTRSALCTQCKAVPRFLRIILWQAEDAVRLLGQPQRCYIFVRSTVTASAGISSCKSYQRQLQTSKM